MALIVALTLTLTVALTLALTLALALAPAPTLSLALAVTLSRRVQRRDPPGSPEQQQSLLGQRRVHRRYPGGLHALAQPATRTAGGLTLTLTPTLTLMLTPDANP